MAKRRLNDEQERNVALSHLCLVSPDFIKRNYNVSDATTQNILRKRSRSWSDSLIEFYRGQNRAGNAIHFYLAYDGETEGLPNAELVSNSRNISVYENINRNVFSPRLHRIEVQMALGNIADPPKDSPESRLLAVIFGSGRSRFEEEVVSPIKHQKLREVYLDLTQGKFRGTSNDKIIDVAYERIRNGIANKLGEAWRVARDKNVRELIAQQDSQLKEKVREVLNTLTEREREIVGLRYGLSDGKRYTIKEVGKRCMVTRERVRQIEARAIRKFQLPKTYNILAPYVERELIPIEPQIAEQRILANKDIPFDLIQKQVSELVLSIRTRKLLRRAGVDTIRELCNLTEQDILSVRNSGYTSLNEIKRILQDIGLSLKARN